MPDPSSFADHFSGHAALYRRHRPTYPDALYAWLAGLAEGRERAWDCATGNGQAAVGLAGHVERVVGTDASMEQLRHARRHPRVAYVAAMAERSPFRSARLDIVTVAQAVHWFRLEDFWTEVRRVLRPDGVVAVWTYDLFSVDPDVDAVTRWFYAEVVGPWWPPERRIVEDGYRTLPFPFEEVADVPDFVMRPRWRRQDVLGQVSTWSSTRRHRSRTGEDPLERLAPRLREVWPDGGEERAVTWPLRLRVGRPRGGDSGLTRGG